MLFPSFEFFYGAKQEVAKNYATDTWDDDVDLFSTLLSMKKFPGVSL